MTTERSSPADTMPSQASASTDDDFVHQLSTEIAALRAFVEHFVAAKIDGTTIRIRHFWSRLVVRCLLGALVLFLAATLIVYLVRGIDGGLVAAFEREWVGHLVTGVLGLLMLAGIIKVASMEAERRHRCRSVEKFEQRKASQREQVGHDIEGAGCVPQ